MDIAALFHKNKLSKREFLRCSFMGACGLAAASTPLRLLGSGSKKPDLTGEKLWKWSTEAHYYIQTPKGIKCKLCPQNCDIKEGETGDCRTRLNIDGKLHCIAYGNPCAVHVDPIEKKPLYHFLPSTKSFSIATAGCNLACLNCQNWEISQASPKDTRNYDLMPEKVVEQAASNDCKSIAYTYSDPVAFYEYTYDTSKTARLQGIRNVLISAGYINEEPLRKLSAYIDAANIDLKSFSNEIYEMLNAGTLQPVLDTLRILKEEGVWTEITNLIVPTWNDDMEMIGKMCEWLVKNGMKNFPLHFSRFNPLYKLTNLPATPVKTLEKARSTAVKAGMKFVYIGNVPGHDAENTYCPKCQSLIILRKGFHIGDFRIKSQCCEYCGEPIPGVWA